MRENILLAAFDLGAVLLLLALSSRGFKLFGNETSGAGRRWALPLARVAGAILVGVGLLLSIRAQSESTSGSQGAAGLSTNDGSTTATQTRSDSSRADRSTNGSVIQPTQTPADKPKTGLPAGVISDNEDSVQILDVSPEPGTYLRRLEPRVFKIKVAYNLKSADVALLSMSLAQIRESRGCAGMGHLPDATSVEIKRGRHIVDLDLEWTGDTGKKSGGLVDMKGYIRFVPMFWQRLAGGTRGKRIRLFEGYEKVCMRFGQ